MLISNKLRDAKLALEVARWRWADKGAGENLINWRLLEEARANLARVRAEEPTEEE